MLIRIIRVNLWFLPKTKLYIKFMKQIIQTTLAVLLCATTLSGCYDLDRVPSNQLSSLSFYKNQTHADEAMMGVYAVMRNDYLMGLEFVFDALGGISMSYDSWTFPDIQVGTYDANHGKMFSKFQTTYEAIARANLVIQNTDRTDMSDDLKARYKGEARFMRGLYYFYLLRLWGGVPIYDENTIVAEKFNEMMEPRSSAAEVSAFIIKDLEMAADVLPEQWDAANLGRATRSAAQALMGKVYLYDKQYQKASECFAQVINSGLHQLYPVYADLFKQTADNSSEIIFAIQTTSGATSDIGLPFGFRLGTRSTYGSSWNNVLAASSFVETYEYKDGRPFSWDEMFPGFSTNDNVKKQTFRCSFDKNKHKVITYPASKPKLLEMYEQRDPRMMASIIMPYTHYLGWANNAAIDCEYVICGGSVSSPGWGYIQVNSGREAFLWRKFVPEGDMNGQLVSRNSTPINFPLIRYADVLLMQAECLNELGKQEEAVALINQVRQRAGVALLNNGSEWTKATTKQEVFDRIKHERAVELACEGHRFHDLKRWGLLETLNGHRECDMTGTFRYTRKVTERDYLWPIPNSEIEKNPALTQNPGW